MPAGMVSPTHFTDDGISGTRFDCPGFTAMTNFPTVLTHLCGTFEEDRTDFPASLEDYDLLIIDDPGAERNTDYAMELMFSIVDSRILLFFQTFRRQKLSNRHGFWMFHIQAQEILISGKNNINIGYNGRI